MKRVLTAVLATVLIVASMVPVLYAPAATHAQDSGPLGPTASPKGQFRQVCRN